MQLRFRGYWKVTLIRAYADEAIAWATQFSDPQRDAVRHAYWMALCASNPEVGADDALFIALGHEVTYKPIQQAFLSTMDLHNNVAGSEIIRVVKGPGAGEKPLPNRPAIQAAVLEKYALGALWIWDGPAGPNDGNGQVIKSDGMKIFPSEEPAP